MEIISNNSFNRKVCKFVKEDATPVNYVRVKLKESFILSYFFLTHFMYFCGEHESKVKMSLSNEKKITVEGRAKPTITTHIYFSTQSEVPHGFEISYIFRKWNSYVLGRGAKHPKANKKLVRHCS